MLLSELVYNVKNLIAGGIESDDENLANSQVAFIIGYYRARLLRQDKLKGRMNHELTVQNLGRVPLVKADKNECCDIEDCILRTALPIPRPLETYDSLNITFVGNNSGKPYTKENHNSMYWATSQKYTGKDPRWYYQNGYIYIVNPPSLMLNEINIQGIFEDPMVAELYRTCDCNNPDPCIDEDNLDFKYPMPLHYTDLIVKMIAESELQILVSLPTDISNDSLDQVARLIDARGK